MKKLLLTLLHLAVVTAKLCGPGGVRSVIAENLLLKQQLIVLRRARQRAPNLALSDRLICALGSLFLSPGRICKVAIGVRLCVSNWEFETHRRTPMATLQIRPGLRKSDPNAQISRSLSARFGARWRARRRTISCCLSRRFSAITARTPPGPHSFAVTTAR